MSRVYNVYRPIEAGTGASIVQGLHSTPIQILGEVGILGLTVVIIFVWLVIRLWYRLYCHLSKPLQHYLLYGIGGSLLGYSGSALTEYQLENIGISAIIVLILVLLLDLADEANLETADSLPITFRRGVSLVGIGFLSFACLASFPLSVAIVVHEQGEFFLEQNERVKAFERFKLASEIVPWQPVYPVHLGQRFLNLRETAKSGQEFESLSELAVQYLQQGIKAGPNDQWFHYTLGVALFPINPKKAEEAFSRVIQLLPRGNFYSYYWLALSYLETNQPRSKIITALALQGLVKPEFLTFPVWEKNQQLSPLKDAVLQKTLDYLEELQSRLTSDTKEYNQVYESRVLLRWWHEQPLEGVEMSRLRPLVRGLLVAETSHEEALNIIHSALASQPNDSSLLLLRAWLKPSKGNVESFLAQSQLFPEQKTTLIQQYLEQHDRPHRWLSSIQPKPFSPRVRTALIYTYRNYDVRFIGLIPPPLNLTYYPLVRGLDVFTDYPRALQPLEHLVDEVRTKQLRDV
jgi:tetratricopeptide (TPR) repeat protein